MCDIVFRSKLSEMHSDFKDKVVVVTGATAGIGLAAARMFKDGGAKVVCVARRHSEEFFSVQADVSDREQVRAAVEQILSTFGRIDVLVNNAGCGISGAVEDTTEKDARALFNVDFFGALFMIQQCVPAMRSGGGGKIINVSSVAAELAIPFQAFYSAAKAAILSLSKALRNEVAPFNIKVTAVLPGDVRTDFTSARKKNAADSAAYGDRVARSVAVMEGDERYGMPPELIARTIVKLAARKNPPVSVAGGAKYKLFLLLNRLLPQRLVSFIIGKMYG